MCSVRPLLRRICCTCTYSYLFFLASCWPRMSHKLLSFFFRTLHKRGIYIHFMPRGVNNYNIAPVISSLEINSDSHRLLLPDDSIFFDFDTSSRLSLCCLLVLLLHQNVLFSENHLVNVIILHVRG